LFIRISNKEDLLAAMEEDGLVFEYASDELKNDKEVVLTVVKQSGGL